MPDVYLGRFNRWIEKLFNIKGGPTVLDFNPSVVVIRSMDPPVEERYLQGWNRYGVAANTSALAASNSAFQIRNPAGSNVIAVIEKLKVGKATTSSTTFAIGLGIGQSDLTTIITPVRLDARSQVGTPGASGGALISSAANSAGFLSSFLISFVNNAVGDDLILTQNQELTLAPGDTLRVIDNTVNELFTISLLYRERALESSELT